METDKLDIDDGADEFNFRIRQIIVGNVQLDLHAQQQQPNNDDDQFDLRKQFDFMGATGSVTLVEHQRSGMKMLVDCASPHEREQLLEALHANGIQSPAQITHLVITHWHIDHCGQMALFPQAKLITPDAIKQRMTSNPFYSNEVVDYELVANWFSVPSGIQFAIYTGHSCADLVVHILQTENIRNSQLFAWESVSNCDSHTFLPSNPQQASAYRICRICKRYDNNPRIRRRVAIVGDLFESDNDWMGGAPWQHISAFPDRQAIARWLCWHGADWIVPGHGPAFRTGGRELPACEPMFGKIFFKSNLAESIKCGCDDESEKLPKIQQIFSFDANDNNSYQIFLVQTASCRMLINVGGPAQRQPLIDALETHGLKPASITHVVITHPRSNCAANLSLFGASTIFLCHDISLPGAPFYASLDHPFVTLDNGRISVWRDCCANCRDPGELSVLLLVADDVDEQQQKKADGVLKKKKGPHATKYVLIGQRLNEFICAQLGASRKRITLIHPILPC